ncbi:uncharacterized protein LOC143874574 [Tasmannia lanceolata]|uniref:uncharacterized protein LOC143874574 n=1 Tax=Tasmannia lanceolata TaxID=3420 RepID=UPI0040648B41
MALALAMAPDQYYCSHNLFQSMDSLWFYQNIVTKKTPRPISETPLPSMPIPQDKTLSSTDKVEPVLNPIDHPKLEERPQTPPRLDLVSKDKILPARFNLVSKHQLFQLQPSPSKIRSCSTSPSMYKQPRRRLVKMNSCKTYSELEHDELKGFMDLGFVFNRDELSPHMMKIVPGLQSLGEKKRVVRRPYLSEAWLINRRDSPLLNLRIPPISAASGADMKQHLRFWARTVASEIRQES